MVKRGQLFLISALIISIIILSLGYVYNTTTAPKTDTSVYDISSHINFEGAKVIDYGVINNQESSVETNLKTLVQNYFSTNPQADYTVIYGTKDSLKMMSYTSNPSNLGIGTTSTQLNAAPKWYAVTYDRNTYNQCTITEGQSTAGQNCEYDHNIVIGQSSSNVNQATITLEDIKQTIEFSKGQTFYLIITKEAGDEKIVSTTP